MDFPTKVRMVRAANNWTQAELGKKIGVDWTTVSAWENKKRDPHYAAAQKVEELFRKMMAELNKEGGKMRRIVMLLLFLIFLYGCASPYKLPARMKTHIAEISAQREGERNRYLIEHPELSEEIRENIEEGKIALGMTKEEVKVSWGYPKEVISSSEIREHWFYDRFKYRGSASTHLYFKNGKLVSWREYK